MSNKVTKYSKRTKRTPAPREASDTQAEAMREKGYITQAEAATRMKVNRSNISRACSSGELETETVGGRVYVEWESFAKYAGVMAGEIDDPPEEESE